MTLHLNSIYHSVKEGMPIAFYSLLKDVEPNIVNDLCNECINEDDGQRCTLLTIAARYGRGTVIRLLLNNFKPDLERECVVKIDGYMIEGATALWCAACAGHLNVVKSLVKAGADVNHPTKTNSTPLRAACFDGRLDIVKYLTAHEADINIANKYNNTCLMIASYKGHTEVVSFLLESGANPNEKALCGATALHFASECGHVEVVKELLKYDAEFLSNDSNMTPIKVAAERTREEVVKFLLDKPGINKEERIEALELLGASYANDKEMYDIHKAYKYLHLSMKLRYIDPENPVKKNLIPPVSAYEYWVECQTVYELESIRNNNNSLHMEALTIRERILGRNNPELPQPIIYRGAVFADNANFDRCLSLWMHALKLRQDNHIPVTKDLLRFAQVFSQMLHLDLKVDYEDIVKALSAAILELERNKRRFLCPGPKDDPDCVMEEMDSNISTTLYLLTILTKLLKQCSDEEKFNINRMVFALNQLGVSQRDGQTLLHLSCNSETPVDDFHTSDICKFPCAETTRLLIQCGADVNAMDVDRNTPLHMIVNYHKPVSDFMTLHAIITDLAEAGAHIDCVNMKGETPLEAAATGSVAEVLLKMQVKLSLKCIAANAVKHHKLTYQGRVPRALESFIELHGIKRA